MKKTILLSLAVMLLAGSSFAQDGDKKIETSKLRFGLFVGPTFNSLKPTVDIVKDNNGDYKVSSTAGRTSFSAGLMAEYVLKEDKYHFLTGIGLDWNGGSISATHDTSSTLSAEYASSADVSYKNQYLSIPVGLKMYAFETAGLKVFAQTGVDLSLLLSQKGDWTLAGANVTSATGANEKLNGFAQVTPVNIGWSIGLGAEYRFNESEPASVYGAILYRNGFTDYTTPQSNNKGNKFADGNIRSNTIAVRIGYFFN